MDFFDIFLALMDEKQLRRHLATTGRCLIHRGPRLVIILLDTKVPKGNLVVGTRSGKYRIFGGMPLNGSDGCVMPRK